MKRLVIALLLASAMVVSIQAQGKKKQLTDDQKAVQKKMVEKYDTNKDGKIDKDERAKISKEDKEEMDKAGLGRKKEAK